MKGNKILLLENQSLADPDVYYSKLGLNLPYRDGDEKGRLNYENSREIWSIIFENKEKEIVVLKISTQNLERFKEDDLLGKHGISRVQLISLKDTNPFKKERAISKYKCCSAGELLEIYELENFYRYIWFRGLGILYLASEGDYTPSETRGGFHGEWRIKSQKSFLPKVNAKKNF